MAHPIPAYAGHYATNRTPCRRHAYPDDGPCVLCGAPEHAYCFGDYHGGCHGGWAFLGWWR